jgi:hypothetical protein
VSVATQDATILGRIGMELFSELAVPVDDVRGMGIVVSKLDHDQSIEVDTAPSNQIISWFKKNSPSDRNMQANDVSSHSIDSAQVSFIRKDVDMVGGVSNMISACQDVLPIKESKREKLDQPGIQKMYPVRNDAIADPPPHVRDEIVDFDEEQDEIWDPDDDSNSLSFQLGIGPVHVKDVGPADSSLPVDGEAEQYDVWMAPPPSTQIELPPLSQLHMSQVEALPPELRRQIMARIDTTECYRDSSKVQQEVICIHDPESGSLTKAGVVTGCEVERKPAKKQTNPSAPSSPEHDSAAAKFRQTSLTRMMRLAAVKSGEVETAISLTQLDHLPLELQLQVVNDDLGPIGALSPTKLPRPHASSHKEVSKSVQRATHASEVSGGNDGVVLAHQRDSPTHFLWSENLSMEMDAPPMEEKDTHETEEEDVEDDEILVTLPPRDQRAFFRENVAPLKVFLDENSPSNKEAVETVISFLCQCVTEGQLRDVVVLFRSIRNRVDSWSDVLVLEQLAQALDERHFEIYRKRLDIDWFLGR